MYLIYFGTMVNGVFKKFKFQLLLIYRNIIVTCNFAKLISYSNYSIDLLSTAIKDNFISFFPICMTLNFLALWYNFQYSIKQNCWEGQSCYQTWSESIQSLVVSFFKEALDGDEQVPLLFLVCQVFF